MSDHKIRYAARADIANACNVDDTLPAETKNQGKDVLTSNSTCISMYLLSQSILSRGHKELYVLVEAFER